MKKQSIVIVLTIFNVLLTGFILTQLQPARAQNLGRASLPVLRGSALEIIDSLGKVRASISILPPSRVGGKDYSQTVLLRMIDKNGKPLVKMGLSEDGTGLFLADGTDEGILIRASDTSTFVRMTNKEKSKLLKLQ